MNHPVTVRPVDARVTEYKNLYGGNITTAPPSLILGETNSLYNDGKPGLFDTFCASLQSIDF